MFHLLNFIFGVGVNEDTQARVVFFNLIFEVRGIDAVAVTMKHRLHVYFTPTREMLDIISYFVHSRSRGMKHWSHVYFTPRQEIQEKVCYFVERRGGGMGGGQVSPAMVSSPPPLNVVTGGHRMKIEV